MLSVLVAVTIAASACRSADTNAANTTDAGTADPTSAPAAAEPTEPSNTTEPPPAQPSTETTSATATETSASTTTPAVPVLVTPCFTTRAELVLPAEDWIAADVSSGGGDCLFVLQKENLADTTVIAGELFLSSAGRTFEEFVDQLEEQLAVGQEPDILALQLLNSGASGRNLQILERIEIAGPNRAVILIHESDRRGGYNALSAIVDVPTETDGTITHAIKLWGLLLPTAVGPPDRSPNYELVTDLINSMVIVAQ